jgi:hypothetical protein
VKASGNTEIEISCVLDQHSRQAPQLLSERMTLTGSSTIDVLWPDGSDGHALLSVGSDDAIRTDTWQVRSWRTQSVTNARQTATREVKVEPARLLFSPGLKERSVALYNPGPMPMSIQNIQPSFGYRWCSAETLPLVLKAGERLVGVVQRVGSTSPDEGELQIQLDGEKVIASINSLKPSAPVAIPPYTVAIDFGTSHTSIALRRAGAKDATFLSPDRSNRFPTVVYCRTSQESTWLYGPEATKAFLQDSGSRRGRLVLELKNLLRHPDDDIFEEMPGVTPRRVLAWYFQRLLVDLIMPYFVTNDKAAAKSLRFIFSFPVLDAQSEAENQRTTTLDAARVAGFERFGKLEWAYEPVCAACYVLLARNDTHLQPGERIMVFDSGGGTTDICIGTIERDGNHLTLRNIVTAAATLGEGIQFGGTRITSRLGKKLNQFYGRDLQIRVMYAWGEDDPTLPKYQYFLEADDATIFAPEEKKPWPAKFADLFSLVDSAKIKQAHEPAEEAVVYTEIGSGRGRGISLSPHVTSETAREGMELVKPSINDLLSHELPDKVFAVGGNSLIPEIRRALAELVFSPQEELTDEERNLAVVTGGLWVRELVLNTLPYGLQVTGSGAEVDFPAGSRPDPTPTPYSFWLEPETGVQFTVKASVGDENVILFEPSVRNNTGKGCNVTIQFAVQGAELTMSDDMGGAQEVRLRYAI